MSIDNIRNFWANYVSDKDIEPSDYPPTLKKRPRDQYRDDPDDEYRLDIYQGREL